MHGCSVLYLYVHIHLCVVLYSVFGAIIRVPAQPGDTDSEDGNTGDDTEGDENNDDDDDDDHKALVASVCRQM